MATYGMPTDPTLNEALEYCVDHEPNPRAGDGLIPCGSGWDSHWHLPGNRKFCKSETAMRKRAQKEEVERGTINS